MSRSRRAVLSACGAGVAALAGCANLDLPGGGDREWDTERLAALGEREVPTPPTAFPIAVPDALIDRHRERAHELVEQVPDQPDIPNEAVVNRLRHDREEVLSDLENPDRGDAVEPLDPLDNMRHAREEAAAVAAAYRAATGDLSAREVADRRDRLRADLFTFERDWTYRGDDPATAVVFHRALEKLRQDIHRGVSPERAFPDDPVADVFRVGDIVSHVEDGRAALSDADGLRARYRDGLSNSRPLRATVSAGAGQLRRLSEMHDRELHEYVDADRPPFNLAVEDTPVGRLYREVASSVQQARQEVEAARYRGDPAAAFVEAGVRLASLRTLDAVVTAIENGNLQTPGGVDEVAAARQRAVDALETAWKASPTILAVTVARPAYYFLRHGTRRLGGHPSGGQEDHEPDADDAHNAFESFVRATYYAEAVPQTIADAREVLDGVAE